MLQNGSTKPLGHSPAGSRRKRAPASQVGSLAPRVKGRPSNLKTLTSEGRTGKTSDHGKYLCFALAVHKHTCQGSPEAAVGPRSRPGEPRSTAGEPRSTGEKPWSKAGEQQETSRKAAGEHSRRAQEQSRRAQESTGEPRSTAEEHRRA